MGTQVRPGKGVPILVTAGPGRSQIHAMKILLWPHETYNLYYMFPTSQPGSFVNSVLFKCIQRPVGQISLT